MDRRDAVPTLGVLALICALGFDDGGYASTAWGWSSVLLFALLAVLLWRGLPRPELPAILFVGGLAAFVLWTAASLLWTSHVSATVLEIERTALYAVAAAVFVALGSSAALLGGTLGAAVVLCGYGLARWLLGNPEVPLSADPLAGERLSEPIGYANGMALLAAMGILLAVGFAARASRVAFAAGAGAAVPLLASTLSFTLGRGAWLALGLGLAAAFALDSRRLQLAAVAGAVAVPAGAAVIVSRVFDPGAAAAVAIALLCLGSAAMTAVIRNARVDVPRRANTAFAVALLAIPLLAAAAVLVRLGGPDGAYDAFTATPAPVHGSERVLSASGSNRADYWRVAWETYEKDPLLGDGAGSFARNWLAERPVPQPARDAHSLYLETLAEVGPVGLALLLIALAAPFAGRREPIAVAPYAAFLVHAAQDWVWELPAVTVAALACGAAMVAASRNRRVPQLAAVVPAVLCLVAAWAFAGNRALAAATAASDRTDYGASATNARVARTLQPWSGEPWRVLGEAQLATGAVGEARRTFERGLERDSGDWELWLDLGLASDGAEQRRAWSRAASLNRMSPELEELGFVRRNGG